EVTLNLYDTVHSKGLKLIGAHEANVPADGIPGKHSRHTAMSEAIALIERRQVVVAPLVESTVPPEGAAAAYSRLAHHRTCRPSFVIDWCAQTVAESASEHSNNKRSTITVPSSVQKAPKVRTGIIGLGRSGYGIHLKTLRSMEDGYEVVAVA